MSRSTIKDLFASDIERNIEEVIKVDLTDEQIIRDELAQYVATDSIRSHFRTIFDRYAETPNKPHEGIGVWVSGFFGSGKSSFAKYLASRSKTVRSRVRVLATCSPHGSAMTRSRYCLRPSASTFRLRP
jgi:2-phosphoglycerate kinase